MSSPQPIIKVGPHGGKIVAFHNGQPVYAHEAPDLGIHHENVQPGSPFAAGEAAGLSVRIHPSEHDKVQIAWTHAHAPAAEAWVKAHPLPPGSSAGKSSRGGHATVPRAWAEKGAQTAPAQAPAAAKPPHAPKAPAGTVAAAPPPPPVTQAATAAPAPPSATTVPEVVAKAGIAPVEKASLKNPLAKWQDSPRHPVTAAGKKGELVGWETKGTPPIKTGKLVVRFPGIGPLGGFVAAYPVHEVTPEHTTPNAPWHGDGVKVWKADAAVASMKDTLKQKAPGQGGKTMAGILQTIRDAGVPVYAMGGFVRDALQGKASKDIDLGFGCDASEIVSLAMKKGIAFEHPGPGGLVKLGYKDDSGVPPLEGKALFGLNADRVPVVANAPKSTDGDLEMENTYGDFAHGRLWYDPVNDAIVDPTGHGVEDALTHTLRIPVPEEQWDGWVKGSPAKIWRYWKFRARGEQPLDEKTRQFFIASAKKYYGSGSEWTDAGKTSAAMKMGILAGDPYSADAPKKLKAFKDAVVEDMGAAWWNTHWAPHVPHNLKGIV